MMVLLRVGRLQYTIVQVSKERQTTLGETQQMESLSLIAVKLLIHFHP